VIVRVLDEGQYDVPEADAPALAALDVELEAAIDAGDDARYREALAKVLAEVRSKGVAIDEHRITASDLAVPNETMDLNDVHKLLSSEE
jgi:hypothetical protein